MNLKEGFCIFIDTVHYFVFCLHPSKPFGRMVAPSLCWCADTSQCQYVGYFLTEEVAKPWSNCWMLLRRHVALPPSWRKLEKEEMGFLLQVWTKQKQNHKMKNLVAGNSTKNKSKNWKWGYKTQTTKMKKKETKQKKQVGENGRNESRLQDGRRLQKKARVTLKMTKH